ncbi:hypothetical protein MCOR27_008323 [Pyricularia oryzae]|nr:hypothetical protein MCOR27_008323 [Pyricularia oryzae]KAI6395890.1 hypothetical protein MCOR20_010100 [Pyricularia oryzae]
MQGWPMEHGRCQPSGTALISDQRLPRMMPCRSRCGCRSASLSSWVSTTRQGSVIKGTCQSTASTDPYKRRTSRCRQSI